MKQIFLLFGVAIMAVTGCVSTDQSDHPAAIAAVPEPVSQPTDAAVTAPLRVAVFVDRGARGIGMFRWVQLVGCSPDMRASYVDGEMIRNGVLDQIDVLIMPGGNSTVEYAQLQDEGVNRLRNFIHQGGGYIGSCAGCYLLMAPSSPKSKRCAIVPYVDQKGPYRGGSILTTQFTERAEKLTGIKAGSHRVRYHGGPKMIPSDPIPDAEFEVMATFVGDINVDTDTPCDTMTGTASVVAGTYGKGRVFVFADHPEYFPSTWDIVKGAFKYVTGRDVSWEVPQRKPGQLAVGLMCSPSPGPKDAEAYMALVRSDALDITPITEDQCAEGILHHLDALVIPEACDTNRVESIFQPNPVARRNRFLKRGGTVVTWGKTAKRFRENQPGVIRVESGEQAVQALVNLRDNPSPATPQRRDPVKVALYAGPGAGYAAYWNLAELLTFSPLYETTFIDAETIKKGGLDAFDLLVIGGGYSPTLYKTFGEKGCTAIRDFIRNGGSYLGVCAGAFLALENSLPDKPRIGGLVPFREQVEEAYRGWAQTSIRFTDDGFGKLGILGGTKRYVLYWGGPVILPGNPVPDADIKVLAEYRGNMVNTFSGKPISPMTGHAAIIGGTSGKGKIVLCGPHPESSESTQDITCAILQYLTDRKPDPIYPDRAPGAVSVAVCVEKTTAQGMKLGMSLCSHPLFDLQPVTWYEVGQGALEHTDILLFPYPVTKGYTPYVEAFLKNGGRVVEFDPDRKSTTKLGPNISIVQTPDEVLQELSGQLRK